MTRRGAPPARADPATWRAWWTAGAWAQLAPVVEQLAQRVALRMVRDHDVADDIAQDALIRCWRSVTVPDAPQAFVRRVARNLALDYVKRAASRYEVEDDAGRDTAHAAPSALDAIVQREAHERLRLTLRRVPDHLRKPLVLHVFHQRSAQELAEQFATTEGAMKMRLSRARAALRAVYDDARRESPRADLRLTTHAKRLRAIEVRAFVPMPTHDHRIGTWCVPVQQWERLRALFVQGALAANVVLDIDDTHAMRCSTALPSSFRSQADR